MMEHGRPARRPANSYAWVSPGFEIGLIVRKLAPVLILALHSGQ